MAKSCFLFVLLGLAQCGRPVHQLFGQSVEIRRIEFLVRSEPDVDSMSPVTQLRLLSHRPWQRGFYVRLDLHYGGAPVPIGLVASVGFDIKMGPVAYGGSDGELLLPDVSDSLGIWFRGPTAAETKQACSPECPTTLVLGPYYTDSIIPGPRGPDATLWPTRLRVVAQVLPLFQRADVRHPPLKIRGLLLIREVEIL